MLSAASSKLLRCQQACRVKAMVAGSAIGGAVGLGLSSIAGSAGSAGVSACSRTAMSTRSAEELAAYAGNYFDSAELWLGSLAGGARSLAYRVAGDLHASSAKDAVDFVLAYDQQGQDVILAHPQSFPQAAASQYGGIPAFPVSFTSVQAQPMVLLAAPVMTVAQAPNASPSRPFGMPTVAGVWPVPLALPLTNTWQQQQQQQQQQQLPQLPQFPQLSQSPQETQLQKDVHQGSVAQEDLSNDSSSRSDTSSSLNSLKQRAGRAGRTRRRGGAAAVHRQGEQLQDAQQVVRAQQAADTPRSVSRSSETASTASDVGDRPAHSSDDSCSIRSSSLGAPELSSNFWSNLGKGRTRWADLDVDEDFPEQCFELSVSTPKSSSAVQGRVWELSRDPQGCREVQSELTTCDAATVSALLAELHGHIWEACRSPHANYVLQKAIEVASDEELQFMVDELLGRAVGACRHRFGCRVVQRLLERCNLSDSEALVQEILDATPALVRHPFGNFVLQNILQHGTDEQRHGIVDHLVGDLVDLARHRVGSHVVQCGLTQSGPAQRARLVEVLLRDPAEVTSLKRSEFGSFVIREALVTREFTSIPGTAQSE